MRIALTGATGFVGQAVLDAGLGAGHSVRALTRRPQEARDHVQWVEGTLENHKTLEILCEGAGDVADAVIHIAGLTRTPDPSRFEMANVDGTANLLEAVKASGIKRFVFVSSLAAREPGLSAYGASKAKAENVVEASRLDWTIVRPPAVYGPRDAEMLELFRTARIGFVPLPPGGATSIIHVEDLSGLLVELAGRSAIKRVFEPDDGREGGWSHKELARAIGHAVGRRRVLAPNLPRPVLELAAKVDRLLRRDHAKLTADRVSYMSHPNWVVRSAFAVPRDIWKPQIAGEEGLAATADWYRQNDWL